MSRDPAYRDASVKIMRIINNFMQIPIPRSQRGVTMVDRAGL